MAGLIAVCALAAPATAIAESATTITQRRRLLIESPIIPSPPIAVTFRNALKKENLSVTSGNYLICSPSYTRWRLITITVANDAWLDRQDQWNLGITLVQKASMDFIRSGCGTRLL